MGLKGKDGAPAWLLKGLKEVSGAVDWLLKVNIPPGVKKGQKVAFSCNGVNVVARYGGKKTRVETATLFALQSPENRIKDRKIVWVNLESHHLEGMKDLDLIRALELRNSGELNDVPAWMREGLANVHAPVSWLLSVTLPANVKKGQKIVITLKGEQVKAVYGGEESSQAGQSAVFALLAHTSL